MQVAATEEPFSCRSFGCTFLLENSSPLIPEHLQHDQTFVLISSWLILLLRAAAGLLCAPFMSDDIPIVLPRSPFWLIHSGPARGFPETKAAMCFFFFFFFFFPPALCVCVNPLNTVWPLSAQPGSVQLRYFSFLLLLSSWMCMVSSCTLGEGNGGGSIGVHLNGA